MSSPDNQKVFEGENIQAAIDSACKSHDREFECLRMVISSEGNSRIAVEVIEVFEEPNFDIYEEEEDKVSEIFEGYLNTTGLDLEYELTLEGHLFRINMVGKDLEHVLKNNGDVLIDLEYVLSAYKRSLFPDSVCELHVDADDTRRKREDEIVGIVDTAGEKVKEDGDEYKMAPMNPYERRLVHMTVKSHPYLETISLGDGHMKNVLIRYNANKPQD